MQREGEKHGEREERDTDRGRETWRERADRITVCH